MSNVVVWTEKLWFDELIIKMFHFLKCHARLPAFMPTAFRLVINYFTGVYTPAYKYVIPQNGIPISAYYKDFSIILTMIKSYKPQTKGQNT